MEHRGSTREPSGPKERTRRLLREAVRELLRTGGPLTVPAAAERAGVSRATAYRYFPNSARAAEVVRARGAWAFDHETELRTFLRLSLESARERDKPRRGLTSRDLWIADLLESLPPEVRRLRVTASPRHSSRCSEPTPASGPRTSPNCHAKRPPSCWHGWRKTSSRRLWRGGSSAGNLQARVTGAWLRAGKGCILEVRVRPATSAAPAAFANQGVHERASLQGSEGAGADAGTRTVPGAGASVATTALTGPRTAACGATSACPARPRLAGAGPADDRPTESGPGACQAVSAPAPLSLRGVPPFVDRAGRRLRGRRRRHRRHPPGLRAGRGETGRGLVMISHGAFLRRPCGGEALLDPAAAHLSGPGAAEQFARPFSGGDVCTARRLHPGLVVSLPGGDPDLVVGALPVGGCSELAVRRVTRLAHRAGRPKGRSPSPAQSSTPTRRSASCRPPAGSDARRTISGHGLQRGDRLRLWPVPEPSSREHRPAAPRGRGARLRRPGRRAWLRRPCAPDEECAGVRRHPPGSRVVLVADASRREPAGTNGE